MKKSLVPGLLLLVMICTSFGMEAGASETKNRKCSTEADAISTANDLVAYVYPDFQPNLKTWRAVVVSLDEHAWEVSYIRPELMFGGSPTVVMGKETCGVFAIYYSD